MRLINSNFYGIVQNANTTEPIPGATVAAVANGQIITQVIANASGEFSLQSPAPADYLRISSAGYITQNFTAWIDIYTYNLQPDYKEIDNVILPPGTKKSYLPYFLIAGILLIAFNKK